MVKKKALEMVTQVVSGPLAKVQVPDDSALQI